MKTLPFELGGETYHLCLNGAALFDIYDRYGNTGSVLDPIRGSDRAAFDAACWYLAKLAEQGELVRRYLGHDKGVVASPARFAALLGPLDYLRAKNALEAAVALGFGREYTPEGGSEIDLGLAELEKKTAPA